MKGHKRWILAAASMVLLVLSACAAGKDEAMREQQQSLVRELTAECEHGQKQACAKAEGEKMVLYEVYGCHCQESLPPGHKPVWSGG